MNDALSIPDLLQYDQWATGQVLADLSQLSDAQFAHEFAGALTSVRQQSVHLVSVKDRYRARIMGEPAPDVQPEAFTNPAQLIAYAAEVDERISHMVATLSPERLKEEIRHDTRRGLFVLTVQQTLLQVINHGTYHRGQIACLLKLHGVEPVDTDLILWSK